MNLIMGILAVLVSGSSFAASFDCSKSSTRTEHLICSSPEIEKLDVAMAKAYRKASAGTVIGKLYAKYQEYRSPDKDSYLYQDQAKWLKDRESCANEECLRQAYTERIKVLEEWNSASPESRDISGVYSFEYEIFVGQDGRKEKLKLGACIQLQETDEKHAAFNALVATPWGICNWDGDLKRSGSIYTYIPDPENVDSFECKMKLYIKSHTLEIDDKSSGKCNSYTFICGQAGSLFGQEFPRKSRRAEKKNDYCSGFHEKLWHGG